MENDSINPPILFSPIGNLPKDSLSIFKKNSIFNIVQLIKYADMKNLIRIIICTLLIIMAGRTYGQQYTNFRIYPSISNQIEPTIIQHPLNPQILFASAFTIYTSFTSEGIYVSTDGGYNWTGNDTCTGADINLHEGDPGPIIDKNGNFIVTHQGAFPNGMYANYSTNMGQTWSNNILIAYGDQEKGTPATDDVTSSLYYGRTYLVWTRYINPFPIVYSYTTNGGQNWTQEAQINSTPSGHSSIGGVIAVGPSGEVYVSWAAIINQSPFNEDFIGFAKSTNGSTNWTVTENAYDCNGIKTSQLQPWNIRVNGYPFMDVDKTNGPRSGWIYIVTAEKNLAPAGSDPDIVFHRSTNGGANWSQGIRVNQDALNNGKVQFLPAIRIDEAGGINVIYYDNRNITSDSCEMYLSRSDDGGNSWSDYLISDHRFRPRTVVGLSGGNQGDNIGITTANGKLLPVWMDNSSGVYQIWSAIIDYTTIGVKNTGTEIPEKFMLGQNYPNPFNPSTKIKFSLPSESNTNVKLIVYNILGKQVASLHEGSLQPGSYETTFDGKNLPSGVYYYRLTADGYSETKAMVLVK